MTSDVATGSENEFDGDEKIELLDPKLLSCSKKTLLLHLPCSLNDLTGPFAPRCAFVLKVLQVSEWSDWRKNAGWSLWCFGEARY